MAARKCRVYREATTVYAYDLEVTKAVSYERATLLAARFSAKSPHLTFYVK
jgi:hypothetical protein